MIKSFTIFSERCTGSNFLEYSMLNNFHIKHLKYCHKHFFGHDNNNNLYSQTDIDNNLFICLIRDPIEWIDSFNKNKHNVPLINKKNLDTFINNEWYSIYECNTNDKKKGEEIIEDRNIYTKEKYKNIFELRKTKNNYYLHTCPTKFKHVLILKYEDLRDNYEITLDNIKNKFNLQQKNDKYTKIVKYKGTYDSLYVKKSILLTYEIQEYIKSNLDLQQEQQLGYLL